MYTKFSAILIFSFCLVHCAMAQQTASGSPPTNQHYVISTARQENKIQKQFPYDIDVKGADGKVINSAELFKNNDKPLVLLFWLTTCFPCRMEMEGISKNFSDWQKQVDFRLVAISTDFQENYPNFVKRVTENNWPFEAYNDLNREFSMVMPGNLNGLPQLFILDKSGNILFHKKGYIPGDEQNLLEKIKEIAR